jgi:flagellar hook-associated protein 3 FlgL
MASRISDLHLFQSSVRSAQENRSALIRVQNQVSSGRTLHSAADDPGASARVLTLRENLERIAQFRRNISGARAQLDSTEDAIEGVTGVLTRLRVLAVSADQERPQFDRIRSEVTQLFGQMMTLANARIGDRYLFGGFATGSAPITQTGDFSDPAPIVAYGGDSGAIFAAIDSGGAQVQVNVTARELFLGSTDGDDVADGDFVNVFSLLQDFHNRLLDPVANGEPGAVLDDVDAALSQVSQMRSRIGGRANRLTAAEEQLSAVRTALERERSGLEDVDIVEAITELQQRETAYQTSIAVTARVLQPSLLDFLG